MKLTFAQVTADAYISQYVDGNKVMGDPVITYDNLTGKFDWQSQQSQLMDDQEIVFYLEDGCFGDDADLTRDGLAYYLDSAEFLYSLDQESRLYDLLAQRRALSAIGKRGGLARNERKTAASRENGKRGGRPRKA